MSTSDPENQILADETALVGFYEPIQRFTINLSQSEAHDAQWTCVVDGELPAAFRKQGLRVIVSGRLYRTPQLPPARFGGEKLFWIALSKIQLAPS